MALARTGNVNSNELYTFFTNDTNAFNNIVSISGQVINMDYNNNNDNDNDNDQFDEENDNDDADDDDDNDDDNDDDDNDDDDDTNDVEGGQRLTQRRSSETSVCFPRSRCNWSS